MFDESLLRDSLTGGVHGRNGQAQDFSQWDKLGLADGRHADGRHITCKGQRSKVKVYHDFVKELIKVMMHKVI